MELTHGAHWGVLFCGLSLVLLVSVGVLAARDRRVTRTWWVAFAITGLLVIAGSLAPSAEARSILLGLAEVAAAGLIWSSGDQDARRATRVYLSIIIPGLFATSVATMLAMNAGPGGTGAIALLLRALFVIGWVARLALLPLYFWLPRVTSATPALTSAVIVGIVDIAAFGELAEARMALPWLFTEHPTVWLTVALLSMLGGAVLALAQEDVKRMLAFSTIDDFGYLLLGIIAGTGAGIVGALVGALSHALCKVLLFGALAMVERDRTQAVSLADRGLASRYPVAGAAFIVGALGMVGVPPLLGFAGRWRLYSSGLEVGGPVILTAMLAATALALLYYTRTIHRVWLGPSGSEESPAAAPRRANTVLVILAILLVLSGLVPGQLVAWLG